jgi:hypothetical protein
MKRRIIIAAIAAALIVPALSAQVTSFTSQATHGLYGTYIDDIQDVNNYADVEFTRGIGYAGARGTGVSGGFATHIGNLFLGVGYSGDLWSGSATTTKVDGDPADTLGPGGIVTFDNRFDVLLGSDSFGGVKITLALNDFGSDTDENKTGSVTQKRVDTTGSILVGGVWGKNFSLGGGTLKPEFGLNVTFAPGSTKLTDVGTPNSSSTVKDPASATSPNYTAISLKAAADYEFAPQGNVTTTLSGDYTFTLRLKPDAVYEGKNTSAAGQYGVSIGATDFKSSDKGAYITNSLNASYKRSYDIDERWSAAWKAGAGLGFNFTETKYSGTQTVSGVTSDIDQKGTATTTFTVNPLAAAALTYKFASKPFSLHTGLGLGAGVRIENRENKDYTPTTKQVVTTYTYSPLSTYFALGGTLNPTENFTIDMILTGGTGISNFNFYFDATSVVVGFLLGLKI